MESDRDIRLQRQTKRHIDKLGDFGVGMIEADRPEYDGEPRIGSAHRPDPPFDIVHIRPQRRLIRQAAQRLQSFTAHRSFRIGAGGKDLKSQITDFPPLRLRLRGGGHLFAGQSQ